ncbi:MAG: hypothetical protein HFH85_00900 [Lachnospiraceae bacterium]|jgi:hypothetical protein|nr:hypothetical protein [Lachnospiraceae bacterium]
MKRNFRILAGCCTVMLLTACEQETNEERNILETEIQITDTVDEAKQTDIKNYISAENCQKNALCLGEFTYIVLDKILYKVDGENQVEQITACKEAVGTLGDDNLFWAGLNLENNIRIIKMNEQGQISEVGIVEGNQPLSFLDFYDDVIYLGFKLGNVEGYRIGSDGRLAGSASVEEMKLYDEENKAADIRINNPDDKEGIWLYPYHIVGAGYTKTTTGQEFLARHIQIGDIGQEEFILRDNEQDTVLFSYYEDAVIDQEKIVYMSSVDKNKLSVYDLQTGEEREVIELQDGNIELLTISHNRVYGIWNSIKHMKSFLVYIDLEQTELVSCFEAIKGTEYIVINDTVYYIDQASGNLVCKVLL